jgi:hypothetical protein
LNQRRAFPAASREHCCDGTNCENVAAKSEDSYFLPSLLNDTVSVSRFGAVWVSSVPPSP